MRGLHSLKEINKGGCFLSGVSFLVFVNYVFMLVLLSCVVLVFLDFIYRKIHKHPSDELDLLVRLAHEYLPLILVIAVIRTYMYEPFYVPSESMYPQLTQGDVVVVSKSKYDIKFPFTNYSLYQRNNPERGAVAVFKYPLDTSIFYIKRVIGVPNDVIVWQGDDMFINDQMVVREPVKEFSKRIGRYDWEMMGGHKYAIRRIRASDQDGFSETSPFLMLRTESALRESGRALGGSAERLEIIIPPDYYLTMGDNRDESTDGRYWGLVHRSLFVGEAQALVFHLDPQYKPYDIFKKISFERSSLIN